MTDIEPWREQLERTTYFFDVGTEEEYEASNPTGFRPAPGGQLVQETEMLAPVRGARIVLVDSDGVRANMSASWLAQIAWDVFVLDGISAHDFAESGPWPAALPPIPAVDFISARKLAQLLEEDSPPAILDQTTSLNYQRG